MRFGTKQTTAPSARHWGVPGLCLPQMQQAHRQNVMLFIQTLQQAAALDDLSPLVYAISL